MPFSESVALSAFSEEKAMARPIDGSSPLPSKRAQLVLGGDHRDFGAGLVKRLHDGRGAQESRIVHHDFLAGRPIVEVVAGDAVNGGGRPVMIEMLLGLVKLGMAEFARSWSPVASAGRDGAQRPP